MKTNLNYQTGELLSTEEVVKEELGFMIEEAQQSYFADKLAIKKQIAQTERALNDAKIAFPYSATQEVEVEMQLKDLKEALHLMSIIGQRNNWENEAKL